MDVTQAIDFSNNNFEEAPSMFNQLGKLYSIVLATLALLGTQSALAWGTSPASGTSYTWNNYNSTLKILFGQSGYLEAIPEAARLQVELLDTAGSGPGDHCSSSTSSDTPCLWLHGLIPACIDDDTAPKDDYCYSGYIVLTTLNLSIDPVKVHNDEYTAAGKTTNIIGSIDCLAPPANTDFDPCPPGDFPTAIGLPKGGNYNKIFPAIYDINVQGETVDLEAGQLLLLIGPLDHPKGPVLRHCFEHMEPDYTGVVDCGTPQYLRTAQGEVPIYIGGLLFESTTTNLNIGKASTSFAIHVNLLSQTNDAGLRFNPEQIDFSKSLAIEGECEPVLGQLTWNDFNGDGTQDVRLRYDAGCVAGLSKVTGTPDGQTVSLAIRGTLLDSVQFQGTFDVIVNQ
jgi:hypothetical protein